MLRNSMRTLRLGLAWLAVAAMTAAPAQAQFGGLLPRDVRNVVDDARASDEGCAEEGEKKSAGSRILGGIFGRTARRAGNETGLSQYAPVGEFSDQISTEIACKLDPEEQKLAADATLRATRSVLPDGEDGDEQDPVESRPAIGSSASWKSETRNGVSGTSTVTSREDTGSDLDCITVTDVIIVNGEETKANKRMCRPPGSRRYSIVA